MKRTILITVAALLVGACGIGDDETAPGAAPDTGTLRVEREHGEGGPIGLEGSVAFARVEASDGEVVAEEGFDAPDHGDGMYGYPQALDLDLEPGSYTLHAYQRSCDGTCDSLDPPVEDYTCEADLEVEAGSKATATVTIEDGGCTVELAA